MKYLKAGDSPRQHNLRNLAWLLWRLRVIDTYDEYKDFCHKYLGTVTL